MAKRSLPDEPASGEKKAKAGPLVVTKEEREFLLKHGYLVKLNVVPDEVCEKAQGEFEAALRVLDPSFEQGESGLRRCRTPKHTHGIQEMPKLAHLPCVKDVRLHPNVVELWRSLLQEQDISSSWDRVGYIPSYTSDSRSKPWHHTDVSPGFHAESYVPIQSYVQVSEIAPASIVNTKQQPTGNEGDCDGAPCIVLWEHSHLAHAAYFERRGLAKLARDNWHIYDRETIAEWEEDGRGYISEGNLSRFFRDQAKVPMRRLEIRVPRGGMVFWYSASAHMNTSGKHVTNGCVFDGSAYARFVVYTCFVPRRLVTKKDAEKIRKALKEQRCTSHWPGCDNVSLFAKTPHLYSKEAVAAYKELEAKLDVPPLAFDARERQLLPL